MLKRRQDNEGERSRLKAKQRKEKGGRMAGKRKESKKMKIKRKNAA